MRIESFKFNHLIREDIWKMLSTPAFNHSVGSILLKTRDEVSASAIKTSVPLKVGVASVVHDHVAFFKRNKRRYFLLMDFAGGDGHKIGEVA